MSELTPDDIWFCGRIADNHFNSGYLVTTKAGLKGVTYHKDALVNKNIGLIRGRMKPGKKSNRAA